MNCSFIFRLASQKTLTEHQEKVNLFENQLTQMQAVKSELEGDSSTLTLRRRMNQSMHSPSLMNYLICVKRVILNLLTRSTKLYNFPFNCRNDEGAFALHIGITCVGGQFGHEHGAGGQKICGHTLYRFDHAQDVFGHTFWPLLFWTNLVQQNRTINGPT